MTDSDDKLDAAKIFAGPCDFICGAATLDALLDSDLPEVAFAGRSNVGKSSLINALTRRKALARTSKTPGRTQQLNFFNLGGLFNLVDMPGYGYAQISRETKAEWEALVHGYLRGRPTLRCVFILVDSRHGLKPTDHELMEMLNTSAVSCRIVFTKSDKAGSATTREKLVKDTTEALQRHGVVWPHPVFTSAEKKQGIAELQQTIIELIRN